MTPTSASFFDGASFGKVPPVIKNDADVGVIVDGAPGMFDIIRTGDGPFAASRPSSGPRFSAGKSPPETGKARPEGFAVRYRSAPGRAQAERECGANGLRTVPHRDRQAPGAPQDRAHQ